MKRYYEVVAKCGHVGRGFYYEGHFFLPSENASNAAQYVKTFPRVKKDHKDAILWVEEVTYEDYLKGKEEHKKETYFKCEKLFQTKIEEQLSKIVNK